MGWVEGSATSFWVIGNARAFSNRSSDSSAATVPVPVTAAEVAKRLMATNTARSKSRVIFIAGILMLQECKAIIGINLQSVEQIVRGSLLHGDTCSDE